jgi:hypothetical protein
MRVFVSQKFLAAALLASVLVSGCRHVAPVAPPAKATAAPPSKPEEEFVVGPGISHGNLTVFPITSRTARTNDRFITLDEGLAAGSVEVREMGARVEPLLANAGPEEPEARAEVEAQADAVVPREVAPPAADPFGESADPFGERPSLITEVASNDRRVSNEVNKVLVVNKSDRPLYLMPGEIILGGDQDRTIGQELVIAPSPQPTEVDVFCVEHGRWGSKGHVATVAQLEALEIAAGSADVERVATAFSAEPADSRLKRKAVEADAGKFVATPGALSRDARVAAQHGKSQGDVWDKVAAANAVGGVNISSGAFTGQYVEKEAAQRLDPYIKQLTNEVIDQPRVVGVVVAIDGEVKSFDVFESTPLFRKLWPKLLKSYAVDAANANDATEGEPAAPKVCSREDAAKFMKDAIAADVDSHEQSGSLSIEKRDTDKVLLFTARDPSDQSAASDLSGGLGGFGGSVHGFGAAK